MGTGLYLKRADTARFYLGPQDAGTTFTNSEFKLWFPLGTLPVGSILKSVSVDLRLDSGGDSYASDIAFVLYTVSDALLQVGGYEDIPSVIDRRYWPPEGDGGIGTRFTDMKVAGSFLPEGIDLHDTTIYLWNGYDATGSWSGWLDFTWVPTP